MPFTPYHMGPGIAVKAVLRGSFSLIVFGWTQVAMDVQPLVVMLTGTGQLHGVTHTLLGATVLGAGAAVTGKYAVDAGWTTLHADRRGAVGMRWSVALLSAFIGSFSHLALDSIMHSDVTPWYPLSTSNQLFGLVPAADLQAFCVWAGVIGAVVYLAVAYAQSRHNKRFQQSR